MVPVIQPYPAGLTQIGRAQLVGRPQGFRRRISGRHFYSLGIRLFQKLQTDALIFTTSLICFKNLYQVLKYFRSWQLAGCTRGEKTVLPVQLQRTTHSLRLLEGKQS